MNDSRSSSSDSISPGRKRATWGASISGPSVFRRAHSAAIATTPSDTWMAVA
jgi:hypothetical protein